MEDNIEISIKLLPSLRMNFEECQNSLALVIIDRDKYRAQLVHLGEKVIYMNSWQEDRLTQLTKKPQQELAEKEEALENLHAVVQKH
jgi:flagellar biosynthesis chaperone FliJ